MATKRKETEQKSRLLEVLTTDYKWENLLLGILATVAAALSMIIILNTGFLTIAEDFPVLGDRTNQLIFSWFLFGISIFGLFLVLVPFFGPAVPELKKITWPTWLQFLDNSVRTLIFTGIIGAMIFLFDLLVVRIIAVMGI